MTAKSTWYLFCSKNRRSLAGALSQFFRERWDRSWINENGLRRVASGKKPLEDIVGASRLDQTGSDQNHKESF
jgi:hypothetical protein